MVAGPRIPVGHRQRGRHDKDKEIKSNRKTPKQKKQEEKQLEAQEDAIEKTLFPQKFDETPLEPHAKVAQERPPTPPTWYEKKLAMTPSRSYRRSEKDKEETCPT